MTSGVPFHPTDEQRAIVRNLTAYGIPQKEICELLDISNGTLHNYFRREIVTGTARMVSNVAGRLYKVAMGEIKMTDQASIVAMIFILKTRGRWKDTMAPDEADPATEQAVKDELAERIADLITRQNAARTIDGSAEVVEPAGIEDVPARLEQLGPPGTETAIATD